MPFIDPNKAGPGFYQRGGFMRTGETGYVPRAKNITTIARPTYIEEFEDNPPVNPIRSRINNGTNAADTDDLTTYAELQFDSSRSLTPDYANLQLSQFRPLPIDIPTSIDVHIFVSYTQPVDGTGPHHASAIFNARNVFVDSADEYINSVGSLEADQNDFVIYGVHTGYGGLDLSYTEFVHTFNPITTSDPNWWANLFSSSPDNIWVRSWQTDTLNYDLSDHCYYRVYGNYIQYFYD